jgi:hypothetical protein
LAETLLAALEAFLATSLNERIYPYRSKLEIRLRPCLFDGGEPTLVAQVVSGGAVEITHPRDLSFASVEERNAFKSSVLRAIAVIMFQIAAIPDAEAYLDRLGEEDAFSRALDFSDIAISVERVLGSTPKLSLSDWEKEYDGPPFAVQRKLPWDHGVARVASVKTVNHPVDGIDLERMRHDARRVVSVIDIPMWDKAHWQAAIYGGSADPRQPPFLALGFEDEEAGIEIFKGWRARKKETGETNFVRIAILTGIDRPVPPRIHDGHWGGSVSRGSEGVARRGDDGFAHSSHASLDTEEPGHFPGSVSARWPVYPDSCGIRRPEQTPAAADPILDRADQTCRQAGVAGR